MRELYIIDIPYAYFAVVVEDGVVTHAPPISRKSIGRLWSEVRAYYEVRGTVERSGE